MEGATSVVSNNYDKLLMSLEGITPVPVVEILKRKAAQSKILSSSSFANLALFPSSPLEKEVEKALQQFKIMEAEGMKLLGVNE